MPGIGQDRANLLTPVAKAFSTDVGVDVASIGIQVHGGMGFIEETGAGAIPSRRPHRAYLRGDQRNSGDRPGATQIGIGRRGALENLYR